jgi:6-phosphogluconolactonase
VSRDKRVLYAALRSQPFRVTALSIDGASGKLQKLAEAPLADSMANIDLDASGRWLFAASYQGGKITVNGIGKDGAVGPIHQLIQTEPNAHAIHADASNRFVLATSLGGDNVSSWRFDAEKGLLSPNDPPLTASRGTLKLAQSTTTLPAGFTGKPWAADLHLTPDGRYLYASERTSSTLSAFKVDAATGQLQPLGQTPTEKGPRGFAIDSTGRYLIAAGQESNGISLYAIDGATGALGKPQHLDVGKNPNWIEIVDLP